MVLANSEMTVKYLFTSCVTRTVHFPLIQNVETRKATSLFFLSAAERTLENILKCYFMG